MIFAVAVLCLHQKALYRLLVQKHGASRIERIVSDGRHALRHLLGQPVRAGTEGGPREQQRAYSRWVWACQPCVVPAHDTKRAATRLDANCTATGYITQSTPHNLLRLRRHGTLTTCLKFCSDKVSMFVAQSERAYQARYGTQMRGTGEP